MRQRRRGNTLTMVLCLFLVLGAVLSGVVALAGATNGAAEREYRRSQALALAEAGITEARAGRTPHGPRELGAGRYSWYSTPAAGGRLVTARGVVQTAGGSEVTRTVRALVAGGRVRSWREQP